VGKARAKYSSHWLEGHKGTRKILPGVFSGRIFPQGKGRKTFVPEGSPLPKLMLSPSAGNSKIYTMSCEQDVPRAAQGRWDIAPCRTIFREQLLEIHTPLCL